MSGACRTNGGQTPNLPCIFPFTVGTGTTVHDKCILKDYGSYWCATRVDFSGKQSPGHWGTCSQECPGVPAGM